MNHHRLFRRQVLFLAPLTIALAAAAMTMARAADTGPATPAGSAAQPDRLATARALIAQNQWSAAIEELRRLDDRGSADWNNLMGYSHRKARKPDPAAAERYYSEALRIDPRHRGALEYSGELYLTLGDLAKAEARLAVLERVCGSTCAEHMALTQAIAAFKTNGNRPASQP
jgi:Flp pilus assembly protein TadD